MIDSNLDSKGPKQHEVWRGDFGDAYIERNEASEEAIARLTRVWSRMTDAMVGRELSSILEVGANIGRNLRALRRLGYLELWGVEPNAAARERLVKDGVTPAERVLDGVGQSIPISDRSVDMVFTSGVLIHIEPSDLPDVYREMDRVAKRHVLMSEYFSDRPVELHYRGHDGLLFKRDFGSDFLDRQAGWRVLDYGFHWQRMTGMDNMTWWLLERV